MIDEVKKQYGEEIRKYVNDNIIPSLLVGYGEGVYNRNELERRNLTLCNKLLGNPELKDEIVAKIAETGINISSSYFKPSATPNVRKQVFMRKIHQTLSLQQIMMYAVKFSEELEQNKAQAR